MAKIGVLVGGGAHAKPHQVEAVLGAVPAGAGMTGDDECHRPSACLQLMGLLTDPPSFYCPCLERPSATLADGAVYPPEYLLVTPEPWSTISEVADVARDEQEYQEIVAAIDNQIGPARNRLGASITAREKADLTLSGLWEQRKQVFQRQNELRSVSTALTWSIQVRDGADPDIGNLTSRINVVERDLQRARELRNNHLKQARLDRGAVQDLYHWIVSSMAGSTYHGRVDIDDHRIRFELDAQHAGGGLAYRTMAVPYADFAALLRGISGSGYHPGILIHDSPREADANDRLYHSLFHLARRLEIELTPPRQEPPFQYIITSTTAPPNELRGEPWLVLPLSSEPESELLFRKQISFARQGSI